MAQWVCWLLNRCPLPSAVGSKLVLCGVQEGRIMKIVWYKSEILPLLLFEEVEIQHKNKGVI